MLFEGDVFASEAADQKNWRLRLSAQEYKIVWNFSTLVRADFEWIESSNLQFSLRVAMQNVTDIHSIFFILQFRI